MVNSLLPYFAFLDGLGGLEMLVIFVLALMLFGGKRLPEVAKGLGKSIREFKRAASGVEDEIRRAMDMDSSPHRRPPVRRPRSAVTPAKDTTAATAKPQPYLPPPAEAGTAAAAAAVTSETPDDIAPEPPVDEEHDYGSEENHNYGSEEDTPKPDPK